MQRCNLCSFLTFIRLLGSWDMQFRGGETQPKIGAPAGVSPCEKQHRPGPSSGSLTPGYPDVTGNFGELRKSGGGD